VRAGQTLASIAAAYGTTVHRIVGCNRLASYTLYVGQTLRLPARSVVRP
jgi:LysM repeat protein